MSGVQTIERAFALLRALSLGPAGVTDLASRVGLAKSTVSRLLGALEKEGAVIQRQPLGLYELGSSLDELSPAGRTGPHLMRMARPFLNELVFVTNERAGLAVREGRDVLYLDHVSAVNEVEVRDWTGLRMPLHAIASGLVLLAHADAAELSAYFTQPLEQVTDQTMVNPTLLTERVAEARGRGYVWTSGEAVEGISSVGAPVRGSNGLVEAAIHVHGPTYRFPGPGREAEVGQQLAEVADKLSEQMERI
ncbi:MAG: IclR family transcriptional regulator [Acidimicrobiales bacterium]